MYRTLFYLYLCLRIDIITKSLVSSIYLTTFLYYSHYLKIYINKLIKLFIELSYEL